MKLNNFVPITFKSIIITLSILNAQEIASIEHETSGASYHSIVKVDSDTYAVAYADANNDANIATFTISADGTSITEVTSLKHDTGKGLYNSLVQVDSDTYALAYTGADDDGYIATFTISADGTSITEVTSLEHDTGEALYNSLVQVDSDTYALAYTGADDDGYIATFTISADGTSITEVTSLEHDTGEALHNSLVQVDSDTYAIAYAAQDFDGYITTFTISANGSSITKISSLEHDAVRGTHNSFIQVDSDTYALAYCGDSQDGYITTFTITADGSSITKVASLEHDLTIGYWNSFIQVDSDTYVLTYRGTDVDGYIATFTISADGSSITEVASFEYDIVKGMYNSLAQVDSDTYALAYTGDDNDGFITTFTIQSDGSMGSTTISGNAGFRMMSSPIAGQIYGDILDELWTQGMTGADDVNGDANAWTLSTSGSQSSSSWTALSDISTSGASLTAGQGFLTYVFADTDNDGDDDLPVTLKISGSYNGSSVTYGSIPNGNYALAGNPFPFTIDWDVFSKTNTSTAYVWDDATGSYKTWNGTTGGLSLGKIAPLQGFLFLASGGTGSITMDPSHSKKAGTFYKTMQNNSASIIFNMESGSYQDQTFVSFMDNGQVGIDIADANKLLPLSPSDRVVGISYIEGKSLDINNLPYELDSSISFSLDVMYLTVGSNNEFITEEEVVKLSYNIEDIPEHITMSIINNFTGEEFDAADVNEITFITADKGGFPFAGNSGVSVYPQLGISHFTINIFYNELSVNDQENSIPIKYALHQNYPNPFNPATTIRYDLPKQSYVTITVYDMLGREVTTLVNQHQNAGSKSILWNATNFYGKTVSNGIYLCRIQAGDYIDTNKMILLK
jgi:hypothetical protein